MYLYELKRIPMRHLLVILMILFSFTGCEDKEQLAKEKAAHDAQIAQQARAELLAELEAEKELLQKKSHERNETKLMKMGVRMDDGIITIDTNRTKDFFRDLNEKMAVEIKKISEDLEKGIIEKKEAGVEMKDQHIHIDLNKTQNFLQEWGEKIQIFMQELNDITNSLDKNNTDKGM